MEPSPKMQVDEEDPFGLQGRGFDDAMECGRRQSRVPVDAGAWKSGLAPLLEVELERGRLSVSVPDE